MAVTVTVTMQEVRDYISRDGQGCLACNANSAELTVGGFNADGSSVWQQITCKACGTTWTDIYMLSDVEGIEDARGNKIEVTDE
jgi:hypothetical protein